jgi:hypothetical protein
MPGHRRTNFPLAVQLLILFTIAAIVFLLLRSSDYLSVDGGLRAVSVYQLNHPFLNDNNHLLYPINVYTWRILLHLLGIRSDNEFAFLALTQAMNAVAAAGCLAIFYGLCYKLTNQSAVACLATIGLGFSRAFVAHATNSAEPMVGLLWSELSIVLIVYGLSRAKTWAVVAAGLLLALAMATYQSMVLVGVAMIFLLSQWPGGQDDDRERGARVFAVMYFVAASALGILLIYGTAYYLSGTRTATGMVDRFLRISSADVYGGVTLVKIAAVLPGLAYALFPCLPRDCSGFRCLSEEQYRSWIPVAGLAVIAAGLSSMMMLRLARALWAAMTRLEKVVLTFCALGLTSTITSVVYWLPSYDKLWLQPLALLFVITALLLSVALRAGVRIPGISWSLLWFSTLIFTVGLSNLVRAMHISAAAPPYLREAQDVATVVRPTDLLVGDWDKIFALYEALWAARANSFNVPTEAEHSGSDMGAMVSLRNAVARTEETGGEVFFLGLLDLSEGEWKLLIEEKKGPSYDQFEAYRHCAAIVKQLPYHGRVITLRRLGTCASRPP